MFLELYTYIPSKEYLLNSHLLNILFLTWSGSGSVEKAGTLLAHLMLMKSRRAADSHTDSVATSYRYMGVPLTSCGYWKETAKLYSVPAIGMSVTAKIYIATVLQSSFMKTLATELCAYMRRLTIHIATIYSPRYIVVN